MKKILIAGEHSYIGTQIENWLKQWEEEYEIERVSLRDAEWEKRDFSDIDVVINVTAIVHKKENISIEQYRKVNCDLAVQLFDKCVADKVGHYIFISTGAVYGQSDRNHKSIVITEDSRFEPQTYYGITKYEAEQILLKRKAKVTKLAIIRPPMVFDPGCKGNYVSLSKFVSKMPVFPRISNRRSVISIYNLCEFIRLVIDNNTEGTFLPQDKEIVSTLDLMRWIADAQNKKTYFVKILEPIFRLAMNLSDIFVKVGGTYIYEPQISDYFHGAYWIKSTQEAIMLTEGTDEKLSI